MRNLNENYKAKAFLDSKGTTESKGESRLVKFTLSINS